MFGEAPLPAQLIQRLLGEVWLLEADAVEYAAIGYGSYHWRATMSGEVRWLVTADTDAESAPVATAYELAYRLAADGLVFVRAPIRHRHGGVTWEDDGWLFSVWPWLAGRVESGLEHGSAEDIAATVRCLRRLHDHASVERVPALVENWRIPQRSELVALLTPGRGRRGSGPYADEVRSRLAANAAEVHRMLARYDELAAALAADDADFVVTHGEPHAGNIVHALDEAKLIDWDTVRWAPRERDLWSLTDHQGWRSAYGDDVVLSDDALEVYRLQWSLVEVADFVPSLAVADDKNPDLEVAAQALRNYLPMSDS